MTSPRVEKALEAFDKLADANESVEWTGLRCSDCARPLRRESDDPRMPWCDECAKIGAQAANRMADSHHRRAADRVVTPLRSWPAPDEDSPVDVHGSEGRD